MRPLENPHIKQKREQRRKVILTIVLLGILLFSSIGYAFQSRSEDLTRTITYNSFRFTEQQGLWVLQNQYVFLATLHTPYEILNATERNEFTIADYTNVAVYLSGMLGSGSDEIVRNLQSSAERIQPVCVSGFTCNEESLPVKDCSRDKVIIFVESDTAKITTQNQCVIISGTPEQSTRLADEFLFGIFNIIP